MLITVFNNEFVLQLSVDIDDIDEFVAEKQYTNRYIMPQKFESLLSVFRAPYDEAMLERVALMFLQMFSVTVTEFETFLINSCSSAQALEKDKLFVFTMCNCPEMSSAHVVAKKCSENDGGQLLVNISSGNLTITI